MSNRQDQPTTFGQRLRATRRLRGLTLTQVAAGTGISASFLSLLETDKHDLSISRFQKLAAFLGIDTRALMPALRIAEPIRVPARKPARRTRLKAGKVRIDELVDTAAAVMVPLIVILKPGAFCGSPSTHVGQEFALVLEGEVEATIDGEVMLLSCGDSLYFEAVLPHRFHNHGTGIARMVTVSSQRAGRTARRPVEDPDTAIKAARILDARRFGR